LGESRSHDSDKIRDNHKTTVARFGNPTADKSPLVWSARTVNRIEPRFKNRLAIVHAGKLNSYKTVTNKVVMKTVAHRKSGFTLVEIMIVVAIIGLLAAIAIPNFVKARTTSQMNACINNLRQIDGAIQQWALEYKKDSAAAVTEADVTPYLKNAVVCPSGGTTFGDSYTVSDVASRPLCQKVAATHALP